MFLRPQSSSVALGGAALLALTASFTSATALAQEPAPADPAPVKEGTLVIKPAESARKEGWSPGVAIGGTFDFTHNHSVVGQVDGASVTLGLTLAGALEYNRGPHEWRNTIDIGAGVNRSPIRCEARVRRLRAARLGE